jgi:DNA-binding transcriptional MocR family regulator
MRQKQVTQVFKGPCMRHPSSYFVWLPMPEDREPIRSRWHCRRQEFRVNGRTLRTGVQVPQALRLALGSVPLEKLRHALMRVRLALDGATLQ